MFDTIAYFESLASTAYQDIGAVTGTNEYVQNGHHVLKTRRKLLAAYAGSAALVRARIAAPSLRVVAYPQIRPVNVSLLPGSDPNISDFRREQLNMVEEEEVAVEAINGGVAENFYAVLFLGDGNFQVPRGQPYIIRGVGTTTAVVQTWTNCPITYDDTLPRGIYEIIGMEVISTTGIAARIILPGETLWRAGCICQANAGGKPYLLSNSGLGMGFLDGGFGSFGRFFTTAMPSIEVLCNAADTAQTVFLRCVKVG